MTTKWEAFIFMLGEWEGEQIDDPSQGKGRFSFSFSLDQNILVRRNRTVFPETPEQTKFIHDDLLIVYSEGTGAKRAIYFDNEGHVIHYQVHVSADQKTISMQSDPSPSAAQFRFLYVITGDDTMDTRFEIAPPGQLGGFSTYLEGKVRRLSQT